MSRVITIRISCFIPEIPIESTSLRAIIPMSAEDGVVLNLFARI